ncbi:MAG: hypothetical protein JO066_05780 [Verrucomicrobia bacterium]|nr:hypothetical protein [Verrucomicrobiota bacterium]
MPGITGIIGGGPHDESRVALDKMVECMVHEKFYVSGTYVNQELGLWIGWTCHEGSFSDCMPSWNEKRDVCLIYSGENFVDPAIMADIRRRGHDFDKGNASYVVHLYEEEGISFLERLNGWFSGVLVDLRDSKVVLFNDRFGINRLCYSKDSGRFYFASEAKSLLRVLPRLRQMDLKSLGEFFSCGCIMQDRSHFSGVSYLPGGSKWTFQGNQEPEKAFYFRKESWESLPRLSINGYYEKLKETWQRILPRYFSGTQPVGLSLTGGVDSRLILAWAPDSSLPCYTWGGMYRECADVKIARQVATACKRSHQVISISREFLSQFPSLAEKSIYISDGALDVLGSVDLYVQRLARQIAPVRISGIYGGEILRLLIAFKPIPPSIGLLEPELEGLVHDAAATYANELGGNLLSFIAFKQAPWYMTGKFAVERSQVTLRTPFLDNDLVSLAYQAPRGVALSNEGALRLIADGKPVLGRFGTDRGVAFRSIPGVTRAHHLFQEFTFKAEYAYDYGMPQWLARSDHVLMPFHLERLFLGRHKVHHFRVWYRDALSRYLKAILLDPRTRARPYIRGEFLEKIIRSHTEGYGNYTLELHKVLTLELIQRTLMEGV